MSSEISAEIISSFKQKLENHPVYEAVSTTEDLQCFMEHHIYSVWDFMSLIKYLQSKIASSTYPWTPTGEGSVRRFINELVLEEESDETMDPEKHASHFELYLAAMQEIGASVNKVNNFIQTVSGKGITAALAANDIPKPSKEFTETTFQFINKDKPHEVAAALALGREHIIPRMFRSILEKIGVSDTQAPIFHFYLNRHIHLDEDFHAPLSLRLLNSLCDGDENKVQESISAAELAVQSRLHFWDGVYKAIKER